MRGYLRAVEALIAIVIILSSYSTFINWQGYRQTDINPLRQSAYDVLNTHPEALLLVFSDIKLLDSHLSTIVPSNLNYKLEAEYFVPLDLVGFRNDSFAVSEVTLEPQPGADANSVLVTSEDKATVAYQQKQDWFRVPFYVKTTTPWDYGEHSLVFSVPYGIVGSAPAPPDLKSFDLYLDGNRLPLHITSLKDKGNVVLLTLSTNTSLPGNSIAYGYLYYMAGVHT